MKQAQIEGEIIEMHEYFSKACKMNKKGDYKKTIQALELLQNTNLYALKKLKQYALEKLKQK